MYYGVVEYVRDGPDGYRPKMLQVPIGNAIKASAGGWFCKIYCGLGHVGCDRRWGGRCLVVVSSTGRRSYIVY